MKRARIGEKFVFTDAAGVWEKMPDGKAKMVFGRREDVGQMVDTDQEAYVYVIFEGKGQKPKKEEPKKEPKKLTKEKVVQVEGGQKDSDVVTVILSCDDKSLAKYQGIPMDKAMMMAGMDFLRLEDGGKVYMVTDRGFDLYAAEMQFEVTEMEG